MTRKQVMQALTAVVDPEQGRDIARLGMIQHLDVEGDTVSFTVLVKDPRTPFAQQVAEACRQAIQAALGAHLTVNVAVESEKLAPGQGAQQPQRGVQHMIAVASGKGGVGKSTVAVNLSVALARQGHAVGLVDTDIYGPSVPTMFGIENQKPRINEKRKILPLEKHGVKLLSMGFMVDPAEAVIWRGPMVSSAVRQFLGDTEWGTLDYLILDLPPGTGDIQLTIVQTVALTGAIIVSTPQKVALADARKGVSMFNNVNVPVLGIVENMAYFTPPDLPDRKYYLFGEGGARHLADEIGVPLLGEIPLEQILRETGDAGIPVMVAHPESASARAFEETAANVVAHLAQRNATEPPTTPIEILYR
ncbi:MAG: Mrp/NBP35 family ATP-binding protein [Rhodothermales bacterium]